MRRGVIAAIVLMASIAPAFGQIDWLGIHLQQQQWNRVQDHQTRIRQGPAAPALDETEEVARLIAEIDAHHEDIGERFPAARRIGILHDGTIGIEVEGDLDEDELIAVAEGLLGATVLIIRTDAQ